MNTPQGGIFALGTASHAYLEFSVRDRSSGAELVRTISALREPRTTMGGVNLVVGFRPELWREVSGGEPQECAVVLLAGGCLVGAVQVGRAGAGRDGHAVERGAQG